MKKFFISMAGVFILAGVGPAMDFTPDTLPHTYCFTDGSCYQGDRTGDDDVVINVKNPSDTVIQDRDVSAVCFGGICYKLDSNGVIK